MVEIITHAPIQTRKDTLQKQERMLSFLASEALIRLNEFQTGTEFPRVDIWNTIGTKTEKDYQSNSINQTREEYYQEQISQRYQILENTYGISPRGRKSLLDSSVDYQQVVTTKINNLINMGVIQVSTQEYRQCSDCEYIYTLAQSPIVRCPDCQSPKSQIITKNGLTSLLDQETKFTISSTTSVFPKAGQIEYKRQVLTLPPILQLTRQREYGHDLSHFGIDQDFVLDPKFSLAMIGSVLQQLGLGNLTTVVQGIDSIGNLAPFQAIFDPNQNIKYITHGTIPSFTQEKAQNVSEFYFPYLALNALSLPFGICPNQIQVLNKEYRRFSGQAKFVINKLKDLPQSNIDPCLTKILKLFNQYSFRDGLLALKELTYQELSTSPNSPSTYFLADFQTLLSCSLGLK